MAQRASAPIQSHGTSQALALVSGLAGTLFGIIAGYLVATQQAIPGTTVTAAPSAVTAPTATAPAINEQELQAYRDILKNDPKNVRAATELGNRLYDAGRYAEAIVYYEQALALDPKNISVSTDLGTAIWYTGDADRAIGQFEKSLAIDPAHGQTLFNMGIVKSQGKSDYKGAAAAWEQLLASNPGYPEADRVRRLLEEAKAKAGA